ncbi:disease resistance protein At4g27190-like [Durio zibethinus]|uniref:Disease resistance protein At4g27190-like n=1 Tax=Durio zibethinus TaxID=66656 RepID=A0A6P5WTU9_DURZI|nr:disease resistance protein At4g27190-like [Durio zibethinus]XP_022718921.1 disease resistance protein At4g27190-like [Durio zibethinus]
MEVLISIVGSLATKAAEYTVDPIARQVSYLFKHESKFQNLKNQLQKLKDAREIVQHSVDEANRNAEQIFPCVNRWLTTVNEKISDQAATQLKEDEEKAKKRCFAELCPNFKSRYQLSKKMEKEANTIAQLLNQKDEFNGRVSYRPAPKEIATRPVKDYEAFESRSGVLNGVMEALEDDNFNIIGVHGMGGVGKTTLVKEVARQAKEKQLLDEVVLVAVTQTLSTEYFLLQREIAEKLGLKLDETSVDVRATRLRDRLQNANKVLVILDDIWVPLDLEKLGIPSRDEHKGCKILMTSRKLNVLERMDSQKNLPIDILKGDEPWKLFKNMAGDIVERLDLQSTAIKVSQKCTGLPIAIATVAKALKHKENLFEWQHALEQLKRPTEVNVGGIPSDVYSAIKLSYNFLENEEVKLTFLLCSIMGHNAAIEDLLRYCKGLGLFRGLNTIEKVRNKVLTLVSELKHSSLLLASFTPEYFDMHDVVCDVAISIASRDHQWLTLREEDVFEEWSDNERVRNFNAIILRYAKVSELPDELECPNLTFFSLGGQDSVLEFPTDDSSLKIPNNFFKQMQRLKVLNFAEMHFSSLPSSVGSLKTLCTLCFLGCVLEDIAIIGELKNLEILDLRRSTFAMLPEKIGQLTKLKLLDLSDCEDLKIISPNVLAGLSRLEELYLYNSFDRWEVEGHDNSRSNASLVELQHLSHLTTLAVHIPNEQALPKDDLFFEKLKRYKISIGVEWTWRECFEMETSRMLKLKMNESIHLYEGVKKLLSETENLWLDDVKNVMDVLYDPNTEGLPHLKHLCVRNVSAMKLISCKEFPLLESLSLCNLINLEAICYGQLKAGSFGRLRVIKVERCNVLKNLFSFSTARELRQLQEIEVCECENLTELIAEKKEEEIGANEEIDILEFNQLLCLKLQDLPSFIRFWNYSGKKLSSSQQGNVQSNAILLFDQKVVFPAIKELVFRSLSSIGKLWDDQFPAAVMTFRFQNLSTLIVGSCHKLKYAFPSSMVKTLCN